MAINGNGVPLDFNKTDLVPRLTIFAEDDSIFSNELVDVILPEKELYSIKYRIMLYDTQDVCTLLYYLSAIKEVYMLQIFISQF